jgi:hypothetical protein
LAGLLPGQPLTPPWTLLAEGSGWQRLYAGALTIELVPAATEAYRNNLASSRPAAYVILRRAGEGMALLAATVDPGEVEAHADAGDDLIEAVSLPSWIAAWIEGFVARHHVERPFYKRQRDRAELDGLGRRPHGRDGVLR